MLVLRTAWKLQRTMLPFSQPTIMPFADDAPKLETAESEKKKRKQKGQRKNVHKERKKRKRKKR